MCIPQNELAKLERFRVLIEHTLFSFNYGGQAPHTGIGWSPYALSGTQTWTRVYYQDLGEMCLAMEQASTEGRKPARQRQYIRVTLKANGNPGLLSNRHLLPWSF